MKNEISKKTYISTIIISLFICLVPILFGFIFYEQFPESLPNRFDFNGNIKSYTNKNIILFALPLIMSLVTVISAISIYYDPFDKIGNNKNKFLLRLMILFPSIMANIMFWATYLQSVKKINIFTVGIYDFFMGIVFIIIGNYMPKNKQNSAIGIKTPWTLKDEINWNKTNRLGGYMFIISGIVLIVSGFFGYKNMQVSSVLRVLSISVLVVPVIYSFYLYKKSL